MLKKISFIALVCSAVGIISTFIIIGSLGEHELSNIMAIVGGTSLITGTIALILFFIGIAQEHQKKIQEYIQNGYSGTQPVLKKKIFVQKLCDDPKEVFQKQQEEKEFANPSVNIQFESQQITKSDKILEKNILEKRHIISAQQKNDPSSILNIIGHIDTIVNKTNETALHLACKHNYIELAQLLLDKGANHHAQDKTGKTPLHTCAMNNSIDIAKLLIDKGARVGILNNAGETPLHKSAEKDFVEISELFLQIKPILLNAPTREGETPLFYCVSHKANKVAQILLLYKPILTHPSGEGTILHKIAMTDNVELLQMILDIDITLLNTQDIYKNTPLHIAIQYEQLSITKALLNYGANTKIKNDNKATPYQVLLGYPTTKMVELLLEHGMNINIKDDIGCSLLHTAVENENIELIKLLLKYKINKSINSDFWGTALDLAKQKNNQDVINLLL